MRGPASASSRPRPWGPLHLKMMPSRAPRCRLKFIFYGCKLSVFCRSEFQPAWKPDNGDNDIVGDPAWCPTSWVSARRKKDPAHPNHLLPVWCRNTLPLASRHLMPHKRPGRVPQAKRVHAGAAGWRSRTWRAAGGGSPGSTAWTAATTSGSRPTGRCSARGTTWRTCTVRLTAAAALRNFVWRPGQQQQQSQQHDDGVGCPLLPLLQVCHRAGQPSGGLSSWKSRFGCVIWNPFSKSIHFSTLADREL